VRFFEQFLSAAGTGKPFLVPWLTVAASTGNGWNSL